MADIKERYGTEAEQAGDKQIIQSIWNRAPSAYEGEKIIVLPYAQYIQIACAVGVTTPQQYKINSIFDPDLTGSGNQPLGRDTWSSIYNYYKVLETHIKMTIVDMEDDSTGAISSNEAPSLLSWMMDLSAAPPTTLNSFLMASMASNTNQQQIFGPTVVRDIINGRGSKTTNFTYKWDASQMDTSIIDNSKNEWSAVGSDPAIQNYFSLIYYNPNSLSATRTITVHTEIQYLVAFKQLNRTLLNTVN